MSNGTEDDVDLIYSHLTLVRFGKSSFLLKQGGICNQYFFVDKGSVRLFYVKNDKDFTAWIGTEGQIFTEMDSYINQTPALVSIQSLEDSLVYVISKQNSEKLIKELPAYNTLLRRTVEEGFASMSRNIISFQSDDASERYRRVEKEKNWLSIYPLKYISSFIGVTQSSLSRLRAKRD